MGGSLIQYLVGSNMTSWNLSVIVAYNDGTTTCSDYIYDSGGYRVQGPDVSGIPQIKKYIQDLGLNPGSVPPPDNVSDVVFRFKMHDETINIGFNNKTEVLGNIEQAKETIKINEILKSSTLAKPVRFLDIFEDCVGAYGLRILNNNYTGPLIRVRRQQGGEQNIGANNDGILDIEALNSFVGNYAGYVTTWYDQSGLGRNFTQSSSFRQPVIKYLGGTLVTDGINRRPGICFSPGAPSERSAGQWYRYPWSDGANWWSGFHSMLANGDNNSGRMHIVAICSLKTAARATGEWAFPWQTLLNGFNGTTSTRTGTNMFRIMHPSMSKPISFPQQQYLSGFAYNMNKKYLEIGEWEGSNSFVYLRDCILSELLLFNKDKRPEDDTIKSNLQKYFGLPKVHNPIVYDSNGVLFRYKYY